MWEVHVPHEYCQLWPTLPVRPGTARGPPRASQETLRPGSHWAYVTLCPKHWG